MYSRLRRPFAPLLSTTALVAALALPLLILAGCGKKGPPEPPFRAVPTPAKDLTVAQQGDRLRLELAYPKTTPAGQSLSGITVLEVWEVTRPAPAEAPLAVLPVAPVSPVPPVAPGAAATPTPTPVPTPEAAALPVGPQPLNPREFNNLATLKATLKAAEITSATQGDRLVVTLPLASPLPAVPQAHYYAVRMTGPQGDRSEFSNQVVIVPGNVPPPPEKATAKGRPDGVEVTWTPLPPAAAAPAILGYNIYRRDSLVRGFTTPLHFSPATESSFVDTTARFEQSYIYTVTTVTQREPLPLLESAIKTEIEVKYADRFPPPTPREPVALVETGKIRVVWRASEAADLAGYRVYRLDLGGSKAGDSKAVYRQLTEAILTDVQYTDTAVQEGLSYVYRVTAVDRTGNESEPAEVRATAQ